MSNSRPPVDCPAKLHMREDKEGNVYLQTKNDHSHPLKECYIAKPPTTVANFVKAEMVKGYSAPSVMNLVMRAEFPGVQFLNTQFAHNRKPPGQLSRRKEC